MPPFSSPPICTMHRPSTITGEHEVKKRGGAAAVSVFRQISLPLAASRQDNVPCTPMVTTFPSATAGELRGPGNCEAAPLAALVANLSVHSSLPVVASRHAVTSSPPRRAKTYSLSPTSAGVATPLPTFTFHFCVSVL